MRKDWLNQPHRSKHADGKPPIERQDIGLCPICGAMLKDGDCPCFHGNLGVQ